ncbi:hypothetical protein C7974DRAFT_428104 [Boeremia exigua]|uniref:uncharacterized protein n=1 Tax=Boeremia exigua TaxID=749465 RepID=UPI001E8D6CE7|nr:uncharacterized protein C7974DRAFT_428104 [Boeremia exigua]KAH6615152.1 hypothetical protein C7974DRAFT_428104 [Boeremia exigua]
MTPGSSTQAYTLRTPATKPSPRQQAVDTTPSKRKCSFLGPQMMSDAKTQSSPNLLQGDQGDDSFLSPDRPVPRKRTKSAPGTGPVVGSAANDDDATPKKKPSTPNSCTRKKKYKNLASQAKHILVCQDPECIAIDTPSSEVQDEEAEDIFTASSRKDQAVPVIFSLNETAGKESSSTSKAEKIPSATPYEATEELPNESPVFNRAASEEPDGSDTELPSPEAPEDKPSHNPEDIPKKHSKLRKYIKSPLSVKEGRGQIYVMGDVSRPHLCKIGRSVDIEARMSSLKSSCKITNLELLHDRPVDLHIRTEVLIKGYLSDFCRPYFCESCNRRHDEWFEIPAEDAKVAVNKWVDFIQRESPYDLGSKELAPFWVTWLDAHSNLPKDFDMETSRKRWDNFMSPSEHDHFMYKFRDVRDRLWRVFWPLYATLAWTATFIAYQHPVAFFLMGISVVGTFINMSHDSQLLRHAFAKSGKAGVR